MRLKDNRPPSPIKITRPKNTPPALRPHSWSRKHVSLSTGRSGRHQGDLLEYVRQRRLLRYKRQIEVIDDAVHGVIIRDEGYYLHLPIEN